MTTANATGGYWDPYWKAFDEYYGVIAPHTVALRKTLPKLNDVGFVPDEKTKLRVAEFLQRCATFAAARAQDVGEVAQLADDGSTREPAKQRQ